jgi:transposase-like protein
MPPKNKAPIPVRISAVARTLGVSGQTVRTWIRKLGITPCATPRAPQSTALDKTPKTDRVVWALTPEQAEQLIRAFRSR